MKKNLWILVFSLLFFSVAEAKIDWKKRNLCEESKYKDLLIKAANFNINREY